MILIIIFLILTVSFLQIGNVYGQEEEEGSTSTSTTTTETSSSPPPVIDPGTGTAIAAGSAAGIIAIVKQLLDQRKNTARDRTTDGDAGRFIILISKFYQAKYLYPNMTDKEILDLPISNNPMSKMTLGQAITAEAELWAVGNQQYWGIPSPQMSVPTMTTVEAVKKSTAPPPTQPPPPGNNAVSETDDS